jgi:Uma2 family endonuclease
MAGVATSSGAWTLEDLDRLPDDGNRYEVVRGELFVTPPPSTTHETVLAHLSMLLAPFVAEHGLGLVYHPRSVIRREGSGVEPDLMVRQRPDAGMSWEEWPLPVLVVEVLSRTTRRRDLVAKRALYLDFGIPEYWIVDPVARSVEIVNANGAAATVTHTLRWQPPGVEVALEIPLALLFA